MADSGQMRPFLKSYAYRSTDNGAIPDALMRGFNVVVIVDVSEVESYPGCVAMSNLLPHPSLVYLILDTDLSDPAYKAKLDQYLVGYSAFLASPEREQSVVNLLASMYKTTHPILLYTEIDIERQFHPLMVLTQFLYSQFGVIVADYNSLFMQDPAVQPGFVPDPKFVYNIAELLFTNAYIGKEEYSYILPPGSIPGPRSVSILLSDFNYAFPTMQAAVVAACNIIDTLRYQKQTGKICPVIQMTQRLDEARQQQISDLVMNSQTRFGKKTMQELNAQIPVGAIEAPK